MKRFELKKKLQMNERLSLGAWITMGHAGIAEIFCQEGYDWVAVDLEHSMIDLNTARELIATIENKGKSPLVRLTSIDEDLIKRVLDHGAHGVIAPMVNSLDDVNRLVNAVYYPPKGKRGVGLGRAHDYGSSFKEYKDSLESDGAIIVVQIEHIKAVENLKEILSSSEVDAYIIGPYDLSASMGLSGDFDHPEVKKALDEIKRVAESLNKCGGIHIVEPDELRLQEEIDRGNNFIAYGVDFRLLKSASCLDFLATKKEDR